MNRYILPLAAAAALSLVSIVTAFAENAVIKAGSIEITNAWTRATLAGQPAGGGFMVIENKGTEADRLKSATSPLTPMVQVHEMKMEGDVMKMSELKDGLEIPAGGKVELKPGSYHIMFMALTDGSKEGDAIKVKLVFEKAGEVDVEMPAAPADAKEMPHQHGG